ncbi:MAG: ornithine carbamoyltransferase [Acidobacteria bacterium]|nr:ornithine carbamoyltransferase [Acidobacteriota bacterium]
MAVRHLLSLADVGVEELSRLVDLSLVMAGGAGHGARPLEGKVAGIYFRGTSTRTRTAFTVAAHRLGAGVIAYGPNDLQISTGETIEDTARVLSGYLDLLVVRTNDSMDEMRALASQDEMAVVNAMSETEHPTQAIADLVTIKEAFGRLRGVHLLYVGEGNNTASALALATSLTPGMRLTLATPAGYGLPDDVLGAAAATAERHDSAVEQIHDPTRLPGGVDVVYATRWQTMGVPKADPDWKEKFRPFSVTSELMGRVSKPSGTIFLHDLPAVRGDDVTDEVLDGPQSLAFRQARHKLSSAMAVLAWCAAPD